MVFANFVASVLSSFLGKFIKGINKDSISVSLLRGSIELRNVELLSTLLDSNGVVCLKIGTIDLLKVKIPWRNLYSKRCEITITGVRVYLVPAATLPSSAKETQAKKKRALALADMADDISTEFQLHKKETEKDVNYEAESAAQNVNAGGSSGGFFKRLQNAILNNLIITIVDTVVQLDDRSGCWEGSHASLIAKIGAIRCEATNEKFQSVFISGNVTDIHRSLIFEDFQLLVGYEDYNTQRTKPQTDDTATNTFKPLLTKCVTEAAVTLFAKYTPESNDGKKNSVELTAVVGIGIMKLSAEALIGVRTIAHSLASVKVHHNEHIIRPSSRPLRGHPEYSRLWWKYAIEKTMDLELAKQRRRHFSWSAYLNEKQLCASYYLHSLKKLRAPWVREGADAKIIAEAEDKLPVTTLIACRKAAQSALDVYGKDETITLFRYLHIMSLACEASENKLNKPFVKSDTIDVLFSLEAPCVRLLIDDDVESQMQQLYISAALSSGQIRADCAFRRAVITAAGEGPTSTLFEIGGAGGGEAFSVRVELDPSSKVVDVAVQVISVSFNYDQHLHIFLLKKLSTYEQQLNLLTDSGNISRVDAELSDATPSSSLQQQRQPPPTSFTVRCLDIDVQCVAVAIDEVNASIRSIHYKKQLACTPQIMIGGLLVSAGSSLIAHANRIRVVPRMPNGTIFVEAAATLANNLEGLEQLKDTLMLLKAALAHKSRDDDDGSAQVVERKDKSSGGSPILLRLSFPSLQFEELELSKVSVDVFLRDGWIIDFCSRGIAFGGAPCGNGTLSVKLWADGRLAESPFADNIRLDDGLGFAVSINDAVLTLDAALAEVADSLYDLAILVFFQEEDQHVYMRDDSHVIPYIRGDVTVTNCMVNLCGDASSPPQQTPSPLKIHARGEDCVVVHLDRYRDKRMRVQVLLSPHLDVHLALTPYAPMSLFPPSSCAGSPSSCSSSEVGALEVVISMTPPYQEELSLFPYSRMRIDVALKERVCVGHIPTVMALWSHFNESAQPLGRVRSIASRIHFSSRNRSNGSGRGCGNGEEQRRRARSPTSVAAVAIGKAAQTKASGSIAGGDGGGRNGGGGGNVSDGKLSGIYSTPVFPGDMVISLRVEQGLAYYAWGQGAGPVPWLLQAHVPQGRLDMSSRDGCVRMEMTATLSFPRVCVAATGEAGAAPSTHSPSSLHSGVLLKVVYTNDSRPPFGAPAPADESLFVSVSGTTLGVLGSSKTVFGPLKACMSLEELAAWVNLLSFDNGDPFSSPPPAAAAPSSSLSPSMLAGQRGSSPATSPVMRRLLTTVRVAPVVLQLPALRVALVLWQGIDWRSAPGGMNVRVESASLILHKSLSEGENGNTDESTRYCATSLGHLRELQLSGHAVLTLEAAGAASHPRSGRRHGGIPTQPTWGREAPCAGLEYKTQVMFPSERAAVTPSPFKSPEMLIERFLNVEVLRCSVSELTVSEASMATLDTTTNVATRDGYMSHVAQLRQFMQRQKEQLQHLKQYRVRAALQRGGRYYASFFFPSSSPSSWLSASLPLVVGSAATGQSMPGVAAVMPLLTCVRGIEVVGEWYSPWRGSSVGLSCSVENIRYAAAAAAAPQHGCSESAFSAATGMVVDAGSGGILMHLDKVGGKNWKHTVCIVSSLEMHSHLPAKSSALRTNADDGEEEPRRASDDADEGGSRTAQPRSATITTTTRGNVKQPTMSSSFYSPLVDPGVVTEVRVSPLIAVVNLSSYALLCELPGRLSWVMSAARTTAMEAKSATAPSPPRSSSCSCGTIKRRCEKASSELDSAKSRRKAGDGLYFLSHSIALILEQTRMEGEKGKEGAVIEEGKRPATLRWAEVSKWHAMSDVTRQVTVTGAVQRIAYCVVLSDARVCFVDMDETAYLAAFGRVSPTQKGGVDLGSGAHTHVRNHNNIIGGSGYTPDASSCSDNRGDEEDEEDACAVTMRPSETSRGNKSAYSAVANATVAAEDSTPPPSTGTQRNTKQRHHRRPTSARRARGGDGSSAAVIGARIAAEHALLTICLLETRVTAFSDAWGVTLRSLICTVGHPAAHAPLLAVDRLELYVPLTAQDVPLVSLLAREKKASPEAGAHAQLASLVNPPPLTPGQDEQPVARVGGQVGCRMEALAMDVSAPIVISLVDFFTEQPLRLLASTRRQPQQHLRPASLSSAQREDTSAASHFRCIRIVRSVYDLREDLLLSRERLVLHFANDATNHITVCMHGHTITLDPSLIQQHSAGKGRAVLLVEEGLTVTFAGGTFRVPWTAASAHVTLDRVANSQGRGEVVLLPYTAAGEGSYVRWNEDVRLAFVEKSMLESTGTSAATVNRCIEEEDAYSDTDDEDASSGEERGSNTGWHSPINKAASTRSFEPKKGGEKTHSSGTHAVGKKHPLQQHHHSKRRRRHRHLPQGEDAATSKPRVYYSGHLLIPTCTLRARTSSSGGNADDDRVLQLSVVVEAYASISDGRVMREDIQLNDLTVEAQLPGKTSTNANTTLLSPLSVSVLTSDGLHHAVAASAVAVDVTGGDILLLSSLAADVGCVVTTARYLTRSEAERVFMQNVDAVLAWRTSGMLAVEEEDGATDGESKRGSIAAKSSKAEPPATAADVPETDGTEAARAVAEAEEDNEMKIQEEHGNGGQGREDEEEQEDSPRQQSAYAPAPTYPRDTTAASGSAGLSVAFFTPTLEATLSDHRYPLLRAEVHGVNFRHFSPAAAMRSTYLQCQALQVDVYGKGRWDVVVPPRAVLSLEVINTTSRHSTNAHVWLRCDGIEVQFSALIGVKLLYVMRHVSALMKLDTARASPLHQQHLQLQPPQQEQGHRRTAAGQASSPRAVSVGSEEDNRSGSSNSGGSEERSDEGEFDFSAGPHHKVSPPPPPALLLSSISDFAASTVTGTIAASARGGGGGGAATLARTSTEATHRFVNSFDCVFFLRIGPNDPEANGDMFVLPPSSTLEVSVPYKRAHELYVYLYPENCVDYYYGGGGGGGGRRREGSRGGSEASTPIAASSITPAAAAAWNGRYVLNAGGRSRNMEHACTVVSSLQYGSVTGLVVDDLLVVLSCMELDTFSGLRDEIVGIHYVPPQWQENNRRTRLGPSGGGGGGGADSQSSYACSSLNTSRLADGVSESGDEEEGRGGSDGYRVSPHSMTLGNDGGGAEDAEADEEAVLVVVQLHAKTALRNRCGMPLWVRQCSSLSTNGAHSPASEHHRQQHSEGLDDDRRFSSLAGIPFALLPSEWHHPLRGACTGVVLQARLRGRLYEGFLNTLTCPAETFIFLHPKEAQASSFGEEDATQAASHERFFDSDWDKPVNLQDSRPVALFAVTKQLVESLSSTITLYPRVSLINHIGVPIRIAALQEDHNAGPQTPADVSVIESWTPDRLEPDEQQREYQRQRRRSRARAEFYKSLITLGAHECLQHRQALPLLQCTYSSNFVLALAFTQCTGCVIQTVDLCEIVTNVRDNVDHLPRLLPLQDNNGRTFYVQVSLLAYTIVLSVGVWVQNLSDYPLLMSESLLTRRLSAGQDANTGIVPSQGTPFLIGCRLQEVTSVFFTIGLDGSWSSEVEIEVGASGVIESFQKQLHITRSCNYVIQFPDAQEGRPVVVLITPRWVLLNNTNKRLKLYFDFPGLAKAIRKAARRSKQQTSEGDGKDVLAALSSVATIQLNPGEYHVSCVGPKFGSRLALQELLEGTVPTRETLSDGGGGEGNGNDQYARNLAAYYECHRTDFVSLDRPGQSTFNLWAAPRPPGKRMGVQYGASLPVYRSREGFSPTALELFDQYDTEAVVTGRLAVSVRHVDNVLAVVLQHVGATKVCVQNRLGVGGSGSSAVSVMARQEGSRRRNVVPPGQNRFFLWEDSRGEHVICVHIVGMKGRWFEVDFRRGECQVTRRSTLDADRRRHAATKAGNGDSGSAYDGTHLPFYVRGFTSTDKTRVTIVVTDTPVPVYAAIGSWRTSSMLSLSISFLRLAWLRDATTNNSTAATSASVGVHSTISSKDTLCSVIIEGADLELLGTEDHHSCHASIHQLQVVDETTRTVIVHRVRVQAPPSLSSAMAAPPSLPLKGSPPRRASSASPQPPPVTAPSPVALWGAAEKWLSHFTREAGSLELATDVSLSASFIQYADGMVRVTELTSAVTPLVVKVEDHFVAMMVKEGRHLGGMLAKRNVRSGGARTFIAGASSDAAGAGAITGDAASGLYGASPAVTSGAGHAGERGRDAAYPQRQARAQAISDGAVGTFMSQAESIWQLVSFLQDEQHHDAEEAGLFMQAAPGGGSGDRHSHSRGNDMRHHTGRYRKSHSHHDAAASRKQQQRHGRVPPGASLQSSQKRAKERGSTQLLLFIGRMTISRITLFVTFTRCRPDPLWPLFGALVLMLPTQLSQKELYLKSFTLQDQVETVASLKERLMRWCMHGLRKQWTKVTRIGSVLELFTLYKRVAPLRRAPRPLTLTQVQFLRNSAMGGPIAFVSSCDDDEGDGQREDPGEGGEEGDHTGKRARERLGGGEEEGSCGRVVVVGNDADENRNRSGAVRFARATDILME